MSQGQPDIAAATMPITALSQEIGLTAVEVSGKSYPISAAMARLTQVLSVNGPWPFRHLAAFRRKTCPSGSNWSDARLKMRLSWERRTRTSK